MRGLRGVTEKVRGYQRKVLNPFGHKRAWRGTPRKLSLHAALLFVVLFAAACSDTTDLNAEESSPNMAAGPVTLDDQFAEVAQKASGFGGMFYDDNGVLTAYMVQSTGELSAQAARVQQREVKTAITAVFGNEVLVSQSRKGAGAELNAQGKADLTILPAKYDFLQLRQWYEPMGSILNVKGVVFTDISEGKNRLLIGVEKGDTAARSRVEQALAKLAIPREAVVLEETQPTQLAYSLQDKVRSTRGGIQIDIYRGGGGECTLGFNAYRSGVRGFITNSHCTKQRNSVESTAFYQSTGDRGTDYIGVETADPRWHTGGNCPANRYCRWSDSAFVRYDNAYGSVTSSLGHIARTTGWHRYSGPLTVNDSYPTFRIRGEYSYTSNFEGAVLNKVGRSTGWTRGQVTRTCTHENVAGDPILMLCQSRVAAGMFGGDSGSPVFLTYSDGSANLYGILWGGDWNNNTNTTSSYFIFSPMRNVEYELGYLTTY